MKAAELYTLAISFRKDNSRFFFARGNCFKMLGEFQRSFYDFTAAIRLDETNAQYYCSRGIILRKSDRPAEAIRDFESAIKIDSSNGTFFFNRALVYEGLGELHNAIEDYGASIKRSKNAFRSLYNRGNTYRSLGRMEESIADLARAVDIEPKNAAGHNNLGLSYVFFTSSDVMSLILFRRLTNNLERTRTFPQCQAYSLPITISNLLRYLRIRSHNLQFGCFFQSFMRTTKSATSRYATMKSRLIVFRTRSSSSLQGPLSTTIEALPFIILVIVFKPLMTSI